MEDIKPKLLWLFGDALAGVFCAFAEAHREALAARQDGHEGEAVAKFQKAANDLNKLVVDESMQPLALAGFCEKLTQKAVTSMKVLRMDLKAF